MTRKQRIYLVLRDLRAAEQPGVLYRLYLNLPPDSQPEKDDPHYVGSLNFYSAVPPESNSSGPEGGLFRSYDLTTLLRNLQQREPLGDRTTITIIPSRVPATNAKASIGRIEIVEQ